MASLVANFCLNDSFVPSLKKYIIAIDDGWEENLRDGGVSD